MVPDKDGRPDVRGGKKEPARVELPNVIDVLSARERKGRNDGLETAALYLEERAGKYWGLQAVYCPNEVRDKLEESAAKIRALKEPTP